MPPIPPPTSLSPLVPSSLHLLLPICMSIRTVLDRREDVSLLLLFALPSSLVPLSLCHHHRSRLPTVTYIYRPRVTLLPRLWHVSSFVFCSHHLFCVCLLSPLSSYPYPVRTRLWMGKEAAHALQLLGLASSSPLLNLCDLEPFRTTPTSTHPHSLSSICLYLSPRPTTYCIKHTLTTPRPRHRFVSLPASLHTASPIYS
ncbi:hypothetical protein PYCCODRAFT_1117443 [Trametes coccinea BRFM310]|uniref:Uncharacterized protein n=1 Tax=Trametes coccinea (strain BRFM310) TaxID=1353009 RepID=A0A1Y2I943_TRAC3|nr:hypothetical protein PYCCODRAFT_1117443 [Trametes coccinea BRFM310]